MNAETEPEALAPKLGRLRFRLRFGVIAWRDRSGLLLEIDAEQHIPLIQIRFKPGIGKRLIGPASVARFRRQLEQTFFERESEPGYSTEAVAVMQRDGIVA